MEEESIAEQAFRERLAAGGGILGALFSQGEAAAEFAPALAEAASEEEPNEVTLGKDEPITGNSTGVNPQSAAGGRLGRKEEIEYADKKAKELAIESARIVEGTVRGPYVKVLKNRDYARERYWVLAAVFQKKTGKFLGYYSGNWYATGSGGKQVVYDDKQNALGLLVEKVYSDYSNEMGLLEVDPIAQGHLHPHLADRGDGVPFTFKNSPD